MRRISILFQLAIVSAFAWSFAKNGQPMTDTTIGGLRMELRVLPAEPFFTKNEVTAGKVTQGMLAMGGEKPLALDAEPHPNHHLVIHLFDVKTGKAYTNAKVKMSFQHLDSSGRAYGNVMEVPVVIMQAIGKGVQSTHYGNNVVIADGQYIVPVVVNGKKISFKINPTSTTDASMDGMNMQ
jgi:hypothetical protein